MSPLITTSLPTIASQRIPAANPSYLYTFNLLSNSSAVAYDASFKNSVYNLAPVNDDHLGLILDQTFFLKRFPSSDVTHANA